MKYFCPLVLKTCVKHSIVQGTSSQNSGASHSKTEKLGDECHINSIIGKLVVHVFLSVKHQFDKKRHGYYFFGTRGIVFFIMN